MIYAKFSIGGGSIHSKKILGGYVCKLSQFPEEKKKGACPDGINSNFYNELEYSCYSSNSFNFKGCLSGYKLNFDFSQKASAPNHFSVACIFDAVDSSYVDLQTRKKSFVRFYNNNQGDIEAESGIQNAIFEGVSFFK